MSHSNKPIGDSKVSKEHIVIIKCSSIEEFSSVQINVEWLS